MNPANNGLSVLKRQLAAMRLQASAHSLAFKAGFRPTQPRVPRGQPDGGHWAVGSGGAQFHRVSRQRGGGRVINGRWQPITPAQEMRLAQSANARDQAIRAVRRVDPKWKAPPQAYETVEGLISANRAVENAARFRIFELSGSAIGPGPFAGEWVPAPSNYGRPRRAEQRQIDRIGRETGCHRCGTKEPKTRSGSFVGDHQTPKSVGTPMRFYPHCLPCSLRQGGLVQNYLRGLRDGR